MDFSLLTDDEILSEIGKLFEQKRLQKSISDAHLIKQGGCSKDALWRFRSGEPITSKNLIKILRGLGELNLLGVNKHLGFFPNTFQLFSSCNKIPQCC